MANSEGFAQGVDAARRLAELNALRPAELECRIEPGLTEAEFDQIEQGYGFEFADDHRGFLATGLPVNAPCERDPEVSYAWDCPWPNWRAPDAELAEQLRWPRQTVLQSHLWLDPWGSEPSDPVDAQEARLRLMRAAPTLVPLYAHRYLPAGRGSFGMPVISVWSNLDVIYYGGDLVDYVDREFTVQEGTITPRQRLPSFWQAILDSD